MAAYLDIYNIYNIYNDICSSYDPHWALYTDHCAPCLADFTHIVRLDEDSELAALLATTGLAALLEDGGSLVTNPTSGGSSASVVRTYMEMLECEEVELIYMSRHLYHIYKIYRWSSWPPSTPPTSSSSSSA